MKNFFLLILILIIAAFYLTKNVKKNKSTSIIPSRIPLKETDKKSDSPQLTTIAEGLDTPWAIAFLLDGDMLVTERPGRVRYIDKKGKLAQEPVVTLDQVKEIGEGGLLGMALHPDFAKNKYVYFYYTYSGELDDTFNRVVRMKFQNNKLVGEEIIVDNIPGSFNHNGGRIKFGPDKNLYITTGDSQNSSLAQDTDSLAGKILRVTDTGKPVQGNSFENLVYSYGHRNPQGIDWDKSGKLWSTEHGRSGIQSGLDELNIIEAGNNYGWPEIQGDQERSGMVTPIINSGPNSTWAPAGAAFFENSLFFAGLRGQTLYEAVIKGNKVTIKEHFKGQFGRLREVIMGPDKILYITTSNQDGRGNPDSSDDRVIRVNQEKL